jgi:hypothetical protein
MAHGQANGIHGHVEDDSCDFFLFFSPFLALNYWIIFLFLHITKVSSRLTA